MVYEVYYERRGDKLLLYDRDGFSDEVGHLRHCIQVPIGSSSNLAGVISQALIIASRSIISRSARTIEFVAYELMCQSDKPIRGSFSIKERS